MPSAVKRELRQEAGFGCAVCGHPYVEYHHIVEWAGEEHFRPEDMVALCPTHHVSLAKLSRERQYARKWDPFNRANGHLNGNLEYEKEDLLFKVGGNYYDQVSTILQFYDTPLISCRLDEGQALVTLRLFNQLGWPLLTVEDNEVTFRVDDLWDFEYSRNYAVARYGPGEIAVRMDFRNEAATIEGSIWLGAALVRLGPDQTTLPGGSIVSGNYTRAMQTAIQIGSRERKRPVFVLR